MVEGRVERHLRPFVGRDRADQVGAIDRVAEDLLKALPVFLDRGDPGHRGVQAGLTHFNWINNRQLRLLLERLRPAVPELRFVVEGVQDRRRVALADAAFDADRGGPAVAERTRGIVAGAARYGAVDR